MKRLRIGLCGMVAASFVLGACNNSRGFRAYKMTAAEWAKYREEQKREADRRRPGPSGPATDIQQTLPGPNPSSGPRSNPVGQPVDNSVKSALQPPTLPQLNPEDQKQQREFEGLIERGAQTVSAGDEESGAQPSPEPEAKAAEAAVPTGSPLDAFAKVGEIMEASHNPDVTSLIKGMNAHLSSQVLVKDGHSDQTRARLSVDMVMQAKDRQVLASGVGELTKDDRLEKKRLVPLTLTGKYLDTQEAITLTGVEMFASCANESCDRISVMALITNKKTGAKSAAITVFQDHGDEEGILNKVSSTLGDRFRTVEQAQAGDTAESSAPAAPSAETPVKTESSPISSAAPVSTKPAGSDESETAGSPADDSLVQLQPQGAKPVEPKAEAKKKSAPVEKSKPAVKAQPVAELSTQDPKASLESLGSKGGLIVTNCDVKIVPTSLYRSASFRVLRVSDVEIQARNIVTYQKAFTVPGDLGEKTIGWQSQGYKSTQEALKRCHELRARLFPNYSPWNVETEDVQVGTNALEKPIIRTLIKGLGPEGDLVNGQPLSSIK